MVFLKPSVLRVQLVANKEHPISDARGSLKNCHFFVGVLIESEYLRKKTPCCRKDIRHHIQTGPNQLNNFYSWPAVVVIQLVWPGL